MPLVARLITAPTYTRHRYPAKIINEAVWFYFCFALSYGDVEMMLAALRQTLKEAWRLGYMSAEEYQRACDLKSVSGKALPRGRSLHWQELEKLLEVCELDPGQPDGGIMPC